MIRFSLDPRGVRVICLWALGLGGLLAPFFFWQGARPGVLFAAAWLALCLGWLPARLESANGSVTREEFRLERGVWFRSSLRLPTRFVSASTRFSTPLLRQCGCCVLVLSTSGALVVLPGLAQKDAEDILAFAGGDRP